MAELYERLGVDYFAVSNVEEALQLREHHIHTPVLILGYTPEECAGVLAENDITQTVYSYDYGMRLADIADKLGVKIKIHIKLDTGMGRIGFLCRGGEQNEIEKVAEVCKRKSLSSEGIFTHFAVADKSVNGDAFTEEQLSHFNGAVDELRKKGIIFEIRHAANSAGIFDHPESHLDMVRAGIVLYGFKPSEKVRYLPMLYPVMTLKSVVSHVKRIDSGESVSYGRTFIADKPLTVATLPVGYADGFWRANSSANYRVAVGGKYAPIIGRICMDQLMIDITECNASVGDEVVIFGDDSLCSADELARINGTINYEITCDVGARVPRAFVENGEIKAWQDYIYDRDLSGI
jgi:alanine racemase